VGPKGVEPLPVRLKGGSAAVTPRPQRWNGPYAFESRGCLHVVVLRFDFWSVVVLRIELSATRISAVFGQPALDYRCRSLGVSNRDGRNRTDTIVFPRHVGLPLPYIPAFSVLCSSDPCGIRTRPVQLERLTTSPEVERASLNRLRAAQSQWVGRRSRPPLRGGARVCGFSDRRYAVSATDPFLPLLCRPPSVDFSRRKKARCPCDTEPFGGFQTVLAAECHKRSGWAGRFAPSNPCFVGRVSCWTEYPVLLRSWIELGRINNIEVTFPVSLLRIVTLSPASFLHSRAVTHLDAGHGQKVRGNSFGDFLRGGGPTKIEILVTVRLFPPIA
jgi:hypothetical protein